MPLLDSNFALYAGTAAALGTGRTTVPTLIGLVDGFPREEHRLGLDTTEHPVESGGTLTDNAVVRPERLKLEGWVSDLLAAPPFVPFTGRPVLAWAQVIRLHELRQPVTVVTSLRIYRDMLIVGARTDRDRRLGEGALRFTLELSKVLFTATGLARLAPDLVDALGPAASRTSLVDGGDKVATAVTVAGAVARRVFGG